MLGIRKMKLERFDGGIQNSEREERSEGWGGEKQNLTKLKSDIILYNI